MEYFGAPKLIERREHMVTNVVRCRQCGFIYTNPKIVSFSGNETNYYDNPEEYFSSIIDDPFRIFDETLNLIEKITEHAGKLLDVGAGKGEFLAAAKMRGWEVFGVEPSRNFVNYAKEKYGIDIKNSFLKESDFPELFFDAVTLNMTLEHVDNPHNLLRIINKILKKTGILYIEVPNMDSGLLKIINLYYRIKGKCWSASLSPLHPPYHCYGYQKMSLIKLCSLNGFKIKKIAIWGIGLRGFRFRDTDTRFRQHIINLLARIMGWLKQGDILIAFAVKDIR